MAMAHGCQLLPTLQTWQGMVRYGGVPLKREEAGEQAFFDAREAAILADGAHLLQGLPYTISELDRRKRRVLVQNLWACTSQSSVTNGTLVEYIKHKKRLDVEQAVAMVLAFVPAEIGSALAPLVSNMFLATTMWRTPNDFNVDDTNSLGASRGRKLSRVRAVVESVANSEPVNDRLLLIRVLMRVRRERPALSCAQRLCMPQYLLALLPVEERGVWGESYSHGKQTEVNFESGSVIGVTKTLFARIQRWLLRLDGDKSEKAVYIRKVRTTEKDILLGDIQLDSLTTTEDPAALAFSFMAVQRRLQLTVVSNLGWTKFLEKGEGNEVLQNRPDIVTSFEEILAQNATDMSALATIRPPPSHKHLRSNTAQVEALIDEVCILMQDYVLMFGHGLFANLRFSRTRIGDWDGRGPEDVYNLLVDLLATLRKQGNGTFSIAPCHKFLAKDIMADNNSWNDDAFAPGKIPGWVQWLQDRQKLRIQLESQ